MAEHHEGDTRFSITGGVGSISYTLAEIADAGAQLGKVAEGMVALVDRMQSEWFALDGAAAGTAAYPYNALNGLLDAVWAGRRVQEDTAALARKSTQAGANYAAAEAYNAAIVSRVDKLTALRHGLNTWMLGPLAPLGMAADAARLRHKPGTGMRDLVEELLNKGPAYGIGAMGPGWGLLYLLSQLRRQGSSPPGLNPAMGIRKSSDATGLVRPGHLTVRQVPTAEWDVNEAYFPPGHATSMEGGAWRVEASIAGLLAGSSDAYKYPPGSIGVVQLVRPDGSNVWLVHLPGTEDWSTMDSTNPFDMEGNLEGMTAAHKEAFEQQEVLVQELMKEALKAAGALPGEEVLLTGHSGGGIHAAAAAADPAFLAEVNVKMIVIAGSPAKNSQISDNIAVLDLQNENDIVTATDFGPPVPTANWVTVTSHRPPLPAGTDIGEAVADAHSLDNYLDDAAALDRIDDPAIAARREEIRDLLGVGVGGAVIVGTKWVFQGRDVDDQPRPKTKPDASGKDDKRGRYKLGVR